MESYRNETTDSTSNFILASPQQLQKLHHNNTAIAIVDDSSIQDFGPFHCHDRYNNYTFAVVRKKGTTFINPSIKDKSLVELKVGVLLPFHQSNNEWTRIMTMSGISAIRLAVAEINAQKMIPGAYITLVEEDSYPIAVEGQQAITQAVYSAISLIQEGVIGVIGDISSSWTSLSALMTSTLQIPQCSFSAIANSLSDKSQFGYFFRTAPTNLLYADAAITFISSQGWPELGVLFSNDDFGEQLAENIVMKARLSGIHIKAYQSFYENGPKSDIQKSLDELASTGARVIFIAAEGAAQLAAMTVAAHSGYINDNTVWMTINADTNTLFSAVNDYNSILARRVNGTDVVPKFYNTPFIDNIPSNTTKATRALNKQSLTVLIDPVEYAARLTTKMTPINYNATFSGGVFMFDILKELPGYAPFDTFLEKWSHLDPAIYPYGGQNNISSNEGLAYSCMMVMANGFNRTIYNSSIHAENSTTVLMKLAAGQLGQYLTPSTFNASFVGPEGPVILDQNGDMASGNFKLYNIQNGSQAEIGRIIAGSMTITSSLIYHDGTTKIPTGEPDRVFLNPGYSSPITITLLTISALGTLLALITMGIVLVYRKREIFRVSSPLFCVLELTGFILAYISLFFFVGYRNKFSCTIIPITFHLGYSLILGNLIAKNYRIYRIFNNIFITGTVITDTQLIKVSGFITAANVIVLISWFATNTVSTINVPVSHNAYYVDCAFDGPNHSIFISLLALIGSSELCFATFLAIKTRSIGRNYSRYSEYKQIGLSIYNIFFSVLIGFIIFFVPSTDYYTRHYLTSTMIVWATTFSLLTLFLPKLHAFFVTEKAELHPFVAKNSDLTGRVRQNVISPSESEGDVMSLNDMMVNYRQYPMVTNSRVRLRDLSKKGRMHMMEVHEAEMPIQQCFKYFPYLAAWEMMQVILMPDISYFSIFSGKSAKGKVFAYAGASIASLKQGEYILKIHGVNMTNVFLQVEDEKNLMQWHAWFNTRPNIVDPFHNNQYDDNTINPLGTLSADFDPQDEKPQKRLTRQVSLDSGITTVHLLGESPLDGSVTQHPSVRLGNIDDDSFYDSLAEYVPDSDGPLSGLGAKYIT